MMKYKLWISQEKGRQVKDDAFSVLAKEGRARGKFITASIIQIEKKSDFLRAVELLCEKKLITDEYKEILIADIPEDRFILMRNSYNCLPKSFLTKEDILVIAMEYANISIKLSPPYFMMDMESADHTKEAEMLLSAQGISVETPKVLPLLQKKSSIKEEPIRYLCKQDIAQMLSKSGADEASASQGFKKALQALKAINT